MKYYPIDCKLVLTTACTIGMLAFDGKFSYAKGSQPFTNVSSYQLKPFLEKDWDENQKLKEHILSLGIDWSSGWLMIDDTIIESIQARITALLRVSL